MRDHWFTSDTHYGHDNILTFKDVNDNLIRPGFTDVEEMNERMIDCWNAVVKPNDLVWHGGDLCFYRCYYASCNAKAEWNQTIYSGQSRQTKDGRVLQILPGD